MASILRVQSAKGTSQTANAASNSFTFGSTMGYGNVIVVATVSGATAVVKLTCADVVWYGRISGSRGTTNACMVNLFWGICVNSSGGTQPVTMSTVNAASSNFVMIGAEYSGFFNPVLDVTDGNPSFANTSSTSPVTGTITTNFANTLCIGALTHRGTWASEQTGLYTSPTNSFIIIDQTSSHYNTSNADKALCLLERITTSTISATCGATITANFWSARGMALRDSGPHGGIALGASNSVNL